MRYHSLLLVALLAQPAGAQAPDTTVAAPRATVGGLVVDSLGRVPLEGATVQLVSIEDGPVVARMAVSDRAGRFMLSSVPRGHYRIGFLHPLLDSIGIEPPQRDLHVRGDSLVRADLAIPPPGRLLAAFCGASAVADSAAVVVGSVRNARDRLPVPGAMVTGEWLELSFGAGGISRRIARIAATTGSGGWFALCDVPRGGVMELVARHGDDSTAVIEVQVPRDGFLRRELYFGAPRALAFDDSVPRADTVASPPAGDPSRLGRLSGTVVSAADAYPLPGVRVSIIDGPQTVANDRGEWTLVGVPLGTRMLDLRAVGFYPERRPVDVITGAPAIHVTLSTIKAVLDTVLVMGTRNRDRGRSGFDDRRRSGLGRYMTASDIEQQRPARFSDLFRTVPGMSVEHDAGALETRLLMRSFLHERCSPALYLDGHYMSVLTADEIDAFVRPEHVMGIEVYSPMTVPVQYQQAFNGCGSIVIWTK